MQIVAYISRSFSVFFCWLGSFEGHNGTFYKLVLLSRMPSKRMLLLQEMMHFIGVNLTSQPLSHSTAIDRRAYMARLGVMCPFLAFLGSMDRFSWHVCDDCMMWPSGMQMCRGFVAFRLFVVGLWISRKCPVHPESVMA